MCGEMTHVVIRGGSVVANGQHFYTEAWQPLVTQHCQCYSVTQPFEAVPRSNMGLDMTRRHPH